MDNHPIPQDVTGFQFKLIGNMTVKQFAYLAVGVILAWVFLQLPISFLIKFPLSAFFAILGIGLAFVPIGGRPMDLMIANFIKALFRPTQFVYEKSGTPIYFPNKTALAAKIHKNNFAPLQRDKLKAYLAENMPANATPNLNNPQINPLKQNQVPDSTSQTFPKPISPIDQKASPSVTPAPTPPVAMQPLIKIIKPIQRSAGRGTGIPFPPDSPSLITGMVKDSRGNPLSNILIEVKDKENNPVRAFKTNEVGRFASATPLLNGAYTIEFEDPKEQNRFEKIAINVAGQIIQPIVAISIDAREELRKELFKN